MNINENTLLGCGISHQQLIDFQDVPLPARKAGLLDVEPECADPVDLTFWDCWSGAGDESSPQYAWDAKESIAIAFNLLCEWSKSLSIPGLRPHVIRGDVDTFGDYYLSGGQHAEGYANMFHDVIDLIIAAGYAVYISDTRLEIYNQEDL